MNLCDMQNQIHHHDNREMTWLTGNNASSDNDVATAAIAGR